MNPAESEESFLTVAEVAGMLKLNQQTVRNWIDQGSLPALRVGRRVRIKRSDFDRVLAQAYTAGAGAGSAVAHDAGPTAEDFWGGEPVGVADPGRALDDAGSSNGIEDARSGIEGARSGIEGARSGIEGARASNAPDETRSANRADDRDGSSLET
jgi:excisionase family DNA binding protein